MIELVEANWPWFLVVLLLGIAVAWFLFVASRRTSVTLEDAEADTPVTRNQALIDAPPVAATDAPAPAVPAAAPVGLAGAGTVAAAAAQEAAVAAAAEASGTDDLTRIKGVGPKLAATLNSLGVTSFTQIAGWSEADIDSIDGQLGRFEGRIRRDDWVTQAALLAEGDTKAYEDRFGKL